MFRRDNVSLVEFFEGGKSMFWPWRRHVVSCLVCSLREHRSHEPHRMVEYFEGQDKDGTVCWSACLSVSWIACNPSSTLLLGCCATGENTITLHRSSVMFYTGSRFLFESSLRSAYWSTSRFMGPRLGICTTIVRRRRIRPLRVYDFDRRINAIFL